MKAVRYRHLHVWSQRQTSSDDTCAGLEEFLIKVYLPCMSGHNDKHPVMTHVIVLKSFSARFTCWAPTLLKWKSWDGGCLQNQAQSPTRDALHEANGFLSLPSNCLHQSRWFSSSGVTVWRQNVIQTGAPVAEQNSSVQICVAAVTSGRWQCWTSEGSQHVHWWRIWGVARWRRRRRDVHMNDVLILEHTTLSFSYVCKRFHVTMNVARTSP